MPYLGKSPSSGVRTRFVYAATAGQTSFSGNDSAGISLAYDDNLYLDVYQNGVLLKPVTDYAATTGTSVVLTTGATTDDVVEMIVYDTFAVADTVSAKDGGAFTGVVSITTDDNNPQLTLTTTDADAGTGPTLDLFRDSASPADADIGGKISFTGKNDANETLGMVIFQTSHVDVTDGNEDAKLAISSRSAGGMVSRLNLDATETVFNEDSIDVDFRVESNSNANMLFVDAGNDKIGIGTNSGSGSGQVTIRGAGSTRQLVITDDDVERLQIYQVGDDSTIESSSSGSNSTNLIFKTSSSGTEAERVRISSGGRVGIGQSSPAGRLDVNNNGATTETIMVLSDFGGTGAHTQISFNNTNGQVGTINTSGSATAFNTSSDYRLKENVEYSWDATSRLKQLKPARFNFIADADKTVDGFLAHETQAVVPEAITGTKDETRSVSNAILSSAGKLLFENITEDDWTAGKLATKDAEGNDVDAIYPSDSTWTASHTEPVMQGIDQSKLVPLLVKTILELEARITALEA